MQGRIRKNSIKGTTLYNLIIVVTIISIFSVIAIPSFTSNDKYQLDLASEQIVFAIRFARSEALRTGDVYGVDIDRSTKQIKVYKADLVANPVVPDFIAYHPINKNGYSYYFDTDLNLASISISNTTDPFLFSDTVRRKSLLFDANGTPIWFDSSTGSTFQLSSGVVELSKGGSTSTVNVQPLNGRVIVQ